jgi:hypothetical protein
MTHVLPPPLDHHYPVVEGRVVTRALEAHVVDHCNLTCAECCSLSPMLPPWVADPADLAADLASARKLLAPAVFKLVGGEPLLHPDLVELVRVVRQSEIAPRISITTNGLLLDRTPDALWKAIDAITISVYPRPALAPDAIAATELRAARFSVALNWKHQAEFVVMNRSKPATDVDEARGIFDHCWIRERCHMLRNGRFYTCTRPPHLQTYHRGAIDFTGDGIVLADLDVTTLHSYLTSDRPLAACAHCFGGSGATMVAHRLLTRDELVRLRR